jgi:hypothetical protein
MIARVLAGLDRRAHQRLDRGCMRMEDADPLSMGAAKAIARALDGVDRLTGFRQRHRAQAHEGAE